MLSQIEAALGTGGLAVVALFGTISFLAWMPAIAGVVISDRPLFRKLTAFLALAVFPPFSLVVMAASIRRATPARRPAVQKTNPPANAPRTTAAREHAPVLMKLETCCTGA